MCLCVCFVLFGVIGKVFGGWLCVCVYVCLVRVVIKVGCQTVNPLALINKVTFSLMI